MAFWRRDGTSKQLINYSYGLLQPPFVSQLKTCVKLVCVEVNCLLATTIQNRARTEREYPASRSLSHCISAIIIFNAVFLVKCWESSLYILTDWSKCSSGCFWSCLHQIFVPFTLSKICFHACHIRQVLHFVPRNRWHALAIAHVRGTLELLKLCSLSQLIGLWWKFLWRQWGRLTYLY